MALGDSDDILAKLKLALVGRWFASSTPGSDSSTPLLDGVLAGPSWMWAWLYSLLQYVAKQRRISTADGVNLDQIASDFFGTTLGRFTGEPDQAFANRIKANLFAARATRQSIIDAVRILTGQSPIVFEPADTTDTGGYGHLGMTQGTGLGYGLAGGYGSLLLPFQAFVTAYRPVGQGISTVQSYYGLGSGFPAVGGYGVGAMEYASLSMLAGLVTDDDIYQTIANTAPEATILWTRITDRTPSNTKFVFLTGRLSQRQQSQTVIGNLFGGSYSARLTETQDDQALSAGSKTTSVSATLAVTQATQILVAGTNSPTTWNQADTTNASLTNANLTVSTSSSTAGGTRSTSAITSGQRYLEVKTTSAHPGERVGFATSTWSETTALGSDANSIGFASDGTVWFNGSSLGTAAPWVAGGTLCIAVDAAARKAFAKVNGGVWDDTTSSVQGTQTAGTTGPIITGPVSGQVTELNSLTVSSVSVTDSTWPTTSSVTLLVSANAGSVTMTVGGATVPGSGTSNISYASTSANVIAALSTLTYSAGSIAGSDTISITVRDQASASNTLSIAVTVQPLSDPSTGLGGFNFSAMTGGALFFAYSAGVNGASATADFGATAFSFPAPTSYTAWSGSPASGPPSGAFLVTPSAETANSISLSWNPLSSGSGTPPPPTSTAPAQAAAVGYNTLTYGPSVTPLGTQLRNFNFFGTSAPAAGNPTVNSDGSITLTNPLTGFGSNLCTATANNGGGVWTDFTGTAFGGGGYFETVMSFTGANTNPGPSWWANDIESMSGGSQGDLTARQWPGQATGYGNWIEVDAAEFDASGNQYGIGNHNFYDSIGGTTNDANTGSYPGWVSPVTAGSSVDWSKPHKYGWLWVPATGSTQGYQKFFFDDVQVGNTLFWNQWSSSETPPPAQGTTAYNVLDTRHLAWIWGIGTTSTPLTVSSFSVWQKNSANNLNQ